MTRPPDPVDLLRSAVAAGLEPLLALARFRALQERFHSSYAEADPVSCHRGCSACCSQLVFDVTAVEVEDLGRHLRRNGREEEVLDPLRQRRDRYDQVRLAHPRDVGESHDDWTERIALRFWSLDSPCVFLDDDGACSVFEHRPQSCRRFFVHGPAELCTPQDAAKPERRSRMVEPGPEDAIDDLLELMSRQIPFDPEDDRLDHAMVRWLENRSRD